MLATNNKLAKTTAEQSRMNAWQDKILPFLVSEFTYMHNQYAPNYAKPGVQPEWLALVVKGITRTIQVANTLSMIVVEETTGLTNK